MRFSKVDFWKNLTCNLNVYVRFSVLRGEKDEQTTIIVVSRQPPLDN